MEKNVTVTGSVNRAVNFAMQQNYVPVIRSLIVNNESEEKLQNLVLKITFEPEFAREYSYTITEVGAGKAVEISPVRLQLSTEFLFSLTEKMVGTVRICLYEGEHLLQEQVQEIELLAYDEWSGLLMMPEIIGAFVTPNHPKVSEILRKASVYLEQWKQRPAFTGYQTRNPNQVKYQMAAIYAALQAEHIMYVGAPASYEDSGQRIRMSHAVLEQKQGTCLDLAVLYASCLEAAGLYPLLVFQKGHAFAGCWLEEETFADCVADDISALEKRVVDGAESILLLECTDYTEGKNVNFERALKHGKDHLRETVKFECVMDIQRSRGSGIRPIPVRLEDAYRQECAAVETEELSEENSGIAAPKELDTSLRGKTTEEEGPVTRAKVWERKLLDFSLRNTLLNFRVTKNAIQLLTANLGELEDQLADGKDFRIMEVPSDWTMSPRDAKMYEIDNDKDLIETIAVTEFKSGRIRTFLKAEELEKNLKNLYRAAKVSQEENGSNTLFLALGMLRWYETDLAEKARYAPLVLIPVDLVKNHRNRGYLIRSRQEDAQINITLLEYLRQDYGIKISGLDPLPVDEHGIDLPLVFQTIRQGIMGKKRWNIENMTFMGLFSFGQFVMWNDLRSRASDLEKNKVVKSLMDGKMVWTPLEDTVKVEELDQKLKPADMAIPMSADSSQMVAIAAAAGGQSFVLHGPPGTGKSQTITNMIANALYQGKSVLFVAEKMAALNVVQKRLEKIGLAPFCLELHSNKTNKSTVLGQLNRALEVGRIKAPEEYTQTAEKLYELRSELNHVIEAMHRKRAYGCSMYEAIETFMQNREEKDKIRVPKQVLTSADAASVSEWKEMVRQYALSAKGAGNYADHPWTGYHGTKYSMELRETLSEALEVLMASCETAEESMDWLMQWSGLTGLADRALAGLLLDLCDFRKNAVPILEDLIRCSNYADVKSRLEELIVTGNEYEGLKAEILKSFDAQVLDYNVGDAVLRWKQTEGSWFLAKVMGQSRLLKELKLYAKNPADITKENIISYYERLGVVAEKKRWIEGFPSELKSYMGSLFLGIQTSWTNLTASIEKSEAVRTVIQKCSPQNQDAFIQALVLGGDDAQIQRHAKVLQQVCDDLKAFKAEYQVDMKVQESSDGWLLAVRELFARYHENMAGLKSWTGMNGSAEGLSGAGLVCVMEAYQSGAVDAEHISSAFLCNLYYGLALQTILEEPVLSGFRGRQYEDLITQYTEVIEKFQNLTMQELAARLSAKVPVSGTGSAASSEVGILKKAIKSNGRMQSIRRLFDQIPTLLRRICPCMLMSPISVAQYIDPNFPKFDLVIFDEASQLPTSTAVGTIARGENVVVVGDPKQLPPTSFFSSNRIDEENCEQEDLESLLDDCLALSMPQEYLKWHYRSRHESLIAYSNMKYYENKLYTFPSPNDLVSEVKLVPVEGFYDKGKTKQNRAEAEAVVAEIVRRLRDEKLRGDSIGVVTFSLVQQHLIDDLLEEEFVKDPTLDEINQSSKEPIFIKNLENVQGDERDVILFSVGYGPDQDGKVSMNFGPLNRDGGWRRLNVAITRARKSMIVYAVIRPEQIDLSRTRSEGVEGLRGFLEFAARGKNMLAENVENSRRHMDIVEEEIADAIRQMGYDVRTNIGGSEYRLDIGVVHPEKPDTYLAGILLDGANCRDAATSKDRFVSQPGVLTGLGWKIMRVWMLEWLDNPASVKEEISAELQRLLEEEKARELEEAEAARLAAEAAAQTGTGAEVLPETDIEMTAAETELQKESGELHFEKIENPEQLMSVKMAYQSARIEVQGTPEEFHKQYAKKKIQAVIEEILKAEAPVSRKVLMRKMLSAWGINRPGARIESVFEEVLEHVDCITTDENEKRFYWLPDQVPGAYPGYRAEDQNGERRSMDEVPCDEILNAVKEVLTEQVSLTKEDLIRETAKKFGYSRMGNVIETSIRAAMEKGVQMGLFQILEDGKVVL